MAIFARFAVRRRGHVLGILGCVAFSPIAGGILGWLMLATRRPWPRGPRASSSRS
jgi:hypothetical protein